MGKGSLAVLKIAALAISVSLIAAGCGSKGDSADSNVSAGNTATTESSPSSSPDQEQNSNSSNSSNSNSEAELQPTETPVVTEAPPAKEPESAEQQTAKPNEKPEASQKPQAAAKPQATAKPEATTKPATAKPSQKPGATAAPKPTPKPSDKPAASAKPTQKPSADDVKPGDITSKITSDIQIARMIEASSESIADVYGFDPDDLLEDGVFLQAMMNTKASEVVVVKLKSAKNYDAVKEGFTKRAERIQKTFETYLQDQYEDALNYQIVRNGNYVLFTITPEQDKVKEIFNGFFKR